MTEPQQIEERLSRLESENELLRRQLATGEGPADPAAPKTRGRGWTVLASTLIILGLVLSPIAVVSGWMKNQLTDTDMFVATFAPLAEDPAVQAFVADKVVTVIEEKINIPSLMDDVFTGIRQLDLPPRAIAALGLLQGPATEGLQSLLDSTVQKVVSSDQFATIWAASLRATHERGTRILQGDPDTVVSLSGTGELGIEIGPIIAEVKERLLQRGMAWASQIPAIDRTIVIATSSSFVTAQVAYTVAVATGTWLPWVAIGLLVVGVLVARRRVIALIWTGAAFGVSMLILSAGLGIGQLFFISTVSPSIIPADAAEVMYDQVVERMAATSKALAVMGLAIALVAWFSSSLNLPTKVRGFIGSGIASLRTGAENRGLSTGSFGEWMHRQRLLVRTVIATVASLALLLSRPLTIPTIVWTVVLAMVAVLVTELLRRPVPEGSSAAPVAGVPNEPEPRSPATPVETGDEETVQLTP